VQPLVSPEGVEWVKALLISILPATVSIDNVLPPDVIDVVRSMAVGSNVSTQRAHIEMLQQRAPDVARVIERELWKRATVERAPLRSFLLGLCDLVVTSAAIAYVAPPPFDPVPDTFNPATRGVALYLNPNGLMGRYPRRYMKEAKEETGLTGMCTHLFVQRRRRTGGIFRCNDRCSPLCIQARTYLARVQLLLSTRIWVWDIHDHGCGG
jgi:hypothetical protein